MRRSLNFCPPRYKSKTLSPSESSKFRDVKTAGTAGDSFSQKCRFAHTLHQCPRAESAGIEEVCESASHLHPISRTSASPHLRARARARARARSTRGKREIRFDFKLSVILPLFLRTRRRGARGWDAEQAARSARLTKDAANHHPLRGSTAGRGLRLCARAAGTSIGSSGDMRGGARPGRPRLGVLGGLGTLEQRDIAARHGRLGRHQVGGTPCSCHAKLERRRGLLHPARGALRRGRGLSDHARQTVAIRRILRDTGEITPPNWNQPLCGRSLTAKICYFLWHMPWRGRV